MPFIISSAHNGWGDLHKGRLIQNIILMFIQLRNLSQNLSMGNVSKFSTFSKFASFYEETIWFDIIIIDEIVFSQHHIFNKKWNSCVNFFLVLCFTPFVADVTFITLLLSNLRLLFLMRLAEDDDNSKIFVYKFYKTYIQSYFVPSLLHIEQILSKLERVFQWLPLTQTTWPQKTPSFQKQPPELFRKKWCS